MEQKSLTLRECLIGDRTFYRHVAVVVLLILVSIGVLEYITPPPPQPPRFPAPPPVHGTSASLFWANQDITLADKNGDLKIYPASTTKMLTCIIALEEGSRRR